MIRKRRIVLIFGYVVFLACLLEGTAGWLF
jgi:hypothetical protein